MITPWAEVRETHTGAVFLAGDRAYKVKKPVDMGFCDFRSLQAREAVCRREVELNRRLAPDVYLGVAELHMPDGHGTEPVVVMRRMAAADRLTTRITQGTVGIEQMRALAQLLAGFHDRCENGPDVAADGSPKALAARWDANLDQLGPFAGVLLDGDDLDEIAHLAHDWIAGREALLDARIAAGRIVDGHGDLLADDIFLLRDGPRVLDCLEFDDHLRQVDRFDDIAFLAMDLERLGAPHLADELIAAYRDVSGDTAPSSLIHHYISYRALVRAKVACIRSSQGDADARDTAKALIVLTLRHLRAAVPALILVGGLPGTGKSSLAGALGDRLGVPLLSTDRIRKELAGLAPDAPAPAPFGEGLYTSSRVDETYAEMLRRARLRLASGESVILDATWSARRHRDQASLLARDTRSGLHGLRCVVPADLAAARMAGRVGPSDADASIAAALAATADPWDEATVIDTAGGLEPACRAAADAVASNPRSTTCAPS